MFLSVCKYDIDIYLSYCAMVDPMTVAVVQGSPEI